MMPKTVKIKHEVCFPPWAETEKSWNLLVKKGAGVGSWSTSIWFPKIFCSLVKKENSESVGILTVPEWLYNKTIKLKLNV